MGKWFKFLFDWRHVVKYSMLILYFTLLQGIAISCKDSEGKKDSPFDIPHNPGKPLIVDGIGPEKGGYGTRVVIYGSNFGNDPNKVKVFFNEKEALVMGVQYNAIYAMCPKQPGENSKIKVTVEASEGNITEAELEETSFKYFLRAAVTTVAGVFGKNEAVDGSAFEASFQRPAKLACNDDGNIVVVVDDHAHKIRLLSLLDNKVVTVSSIQNPFSVAFNTTYDKCFINIRAAARRPELFAVLSKENNYMNPVMFYDQKDENGNYIFGNLEIVNITADEKYAYLIDQYGSKLVRVDQETGKVELIGVNLDIGDKHCYTAFNAKDRMLYIYSEKPGRLYRVDPYHTPSGSKTPWVTNDQMEYILGNGSGAAVEGYGDQARCPCAGITADAEGNLYGCDIVNHVVWHFDVKERKATIFAGTPGVSGYKDGKPSEALLGRPLGVTVTADGIVYVGETTNFLIRRISIQ